MTGTATTIFALSSGRLPAGIAVMRISGPHAGETLRELCGVLPPPRRAVFRAIREGNDLLDRAIVLWLPGPATATGEDMAELHLHGSRAVVAAVEAALAARPMLRPAEAGEFTRRALENGRLDLTETEGLADLLAAETATQRRAALTLAGGALGRLIDDWQRRALRLAATIEAGLDHADEGDVADDALPVAIIGQLADAIDAALLQPAGDRLRDGIRVVLAGRPNVGKSTLLNALVGREAAITADLPGTTRDVIEAPVSFDGIAFVLTDTAGLRVSTDAVERIGVERAESAIAAADIVIWLDDAPPEDLHANVILVHSRPDTAGRGAVPTDRIAVSGRTGEGVDTLIAAIVAAGTRMLPLPGEVALNRRHRTILSEASIALRQAECVDDALLMAEHLRHVLQAFDRLTGRAGVDDMLDALFGTFCIGK